MLLVPDTDSEVELPTLLAGVEVPGLSLLSDFVDVEPADGNEDVDEAPEALELSRVLVVEPTSGDDDW